MILRLFATDGLTPERIFRWSVDETAEHLSSEQVLWVTRLDLPGWSKLVNWFVKHPACRAVVLDRGNRWDWHLEHEVTSRLGQGLYFHQEGVQACCWLHDDMAPPTGTEFKEYLRQWLDSESTVLESPAYQLWDDFHLIRSDPVGIDLAGDVHCWLAKWQPGLRWIGSENTPVPFRPLGAVAPWKSPWPFRHARGVDKNFREGRGPLRKGFTRRWLTDPSVPCREYDAKMTWEEFRNERTSP